MWCRDQYPGMWYTSRVRTCKCVFVCLSVWQSFEPASLIGRLSLLKTCFQIRSYFAFFLFFFFSQWLLKTIKRMTQMEIKAKVCSVFQEAHHQRMKVTCCASNWRKGTALDVMMFFSGIEVKASPAHSTVALIDKDSNPWDLPELKDPGIPWSGGPNVQILQPSMSCFVKITFGLKFPFF